MSRDDFSGHGAAVYRRPIFTECELMVKLLHFNGRVLPMAGGERGG